MMLIIHLSVYYFGAEKAACKSIYFGKLTSTLGQIAAFFTKYCFKNSLY